MAVMNENGAGPALNWGGLLDRVIEKFKIDKTKISTEGKGYPDYASAICSEIAIANGIAHSTAVKLLKREVAKITCWYPRIDKLEEFRENLLNADLSWIVTTNYDHVLESMLPELVRSIGPNEPLVFQHGTIPVYHLHGSRLQPDDIVITSEDYVSLFRPGDYRQTKLSLMLKESTTIFLGYGLGDLNVLTALDWSKNVYGGSDNSHSNKCIQILRTAEPKDTPYLDKNSMVILEVSEIAGFFAELRKVVDKQRELSRNREEKAVALNKQLKKFTYKSISDFLMSKDNREKLYSFAVQHPQLLTSGLQALIDKCKDGYAQESQVSGAFQSYADLLELLLGLFESIEFKKIPPTIFATCARALGWVANYIGSAKGKSFAANKIWLERWPKLSEDYKLELKSFAEQDGLVSLYELIEKTN